MLCKLCSIDKQEADFYQSNKKSCKECIKARAIKNRLEKIEYYRAYDKARASQPKRVLARQHYIKTEAGKAAHSRANKVWVNKHPKRRQASHVVNNAIRDGKLSKHPCFVCGNTNVQGHHPDYDRPLDVIWLCAKHHKETHSVAYELEKAA